MKLQPKRQIAAEVATQKKTLIDEGMKLATKVDVLRETVVKEEGNLERFRKEAVARVQVEIDDVLRVKDRLSEEVRTLEARKETALIPLTSELNKVVEANAKLSKEKEAWGEKSRILKDREVHIEHVEKEVEIDKERAADLKRQASEYLARSDETLKEARKASTEIRNKAQTILVAAEAKEKEVFLKEKEVELLEEWVGKETERQQVREVDLANGERALKDKYATLARTINRMKNG